MKRIQLIAVLALMSVCVNAQKLKGKVFDAASKSPLSGATVSFSGKSSTTDNNGMFSIDCSKVSEITISFVL